MKKYIIGFIIGLLMGGGVGMASYRYIILQDSTGNAITSSNPIPIAIN